MSPAQPHDPQNPPEMTVAQTVRSLIRDGYGPDYLLERFTLDLVLDGFADEVKYLVGQNEMLLEEVRHLESECQSYESEIDELRNH